MKRKKPAMPATVTIPMELYRFLMGEAPLEGIWFGDMNASFRGAFWWRGLLKAAAGWPEPAQGTEARRAETLGSVHDGPVAKPCAQPTAAKEGQ